MTRGPRSANARGRRDSHTDGGTAEGDLVVGADGSNSRVRHQYLPHLRRLELGVLNIAGRVLPATLQDINLSAQVRVNGSRRATTIVGESNITAAGGQIDDLSLVPADVQAYQGSVQAILDADIVVIGPGSLYTSILPNLLVRGIADALRATKAYKIYICNIAMQPET